MAEADQMRHRTASCQCGAVTLEMIGKPIVAATCYCHSCQTGGPGASKRSPARRPWSAADGGTPYVLMRKDRLPWLSGSDRLDEHRLNPDLADAALRGAMLQRAGRARIHQGALAERLFGAHPRGGTAGGRDADDRGRPPRERRAARRHPQLPDAVGQVHVAAAEGVGRDGLSRAADRSDEGICADEQAGRRTRRDAQHREPRPCRARREGEI